MDTDATSTILVAAVAGGGGSRPPGINCTSGGSHFCRSRHCRPFPSGPGTMIAMAVFAGGGCVTVRGVLVR